MVSEPETIVFDTEPLIAYFHDEPGSDTVERYLEAIEGSVNGFVSQVTRTELHYLTARVASAERAETVIEIIAENGIRTVSCERTWSGASYFKREYTVALGDAFSLAAADHVGGTLVAGADDDFDDVTEVDIERFRTEPA